MSFITYLQEFPLPLVAILGGLVSGLGATTLGALPALFSTKVSPRAQDIMMGFGAGVMLAATSFSLIVPAVDVQSAFTENKFLVSGIVALGMLIGAGFVFLCDRYAPHEHFFKGIEGGISKNLNRIWLFVIAVTIHNFPEGLAVGVVFGGDNLANALSLAIGIGIQNMPEGLVVALALISEKYSRRYALGIAALSGLVEPIGGIIGFLAVSIAKPLLPWGLSFAAGAMLYVISHEIIPESHRKGFDKEATAGLILGFILMMILDISLG
ncbi:MAG: ZIP family metal transporter [Candidatus Caenarcaniphilales bacterium]|nr:ZIP family metal transporter [Candidatus Caenarcaniphilales bacterium]